MVDEQDVRIVLVNNCDSHVVEVEQTLVQEELVDGYILDFHTLVGDLEEAHSTIEVVGQEVVRPRGHH